MIGPALGASADPAARAGAGRLVVADALAAVRGGGGAVAAVGLGRGGGRAGAEGECCDGGNCGADQAAGAELKHGVDLKGRAWRARGADGDGMAAFGSPAGRLDRTSVHAGAK